MSSFICIKTILYNVTHMRIRLFSISPKRNKENPFTVSYLIDSLGFSQEQALLVSKNVKFETSEKPDKTIECFRGFGFTQTQILKLIKACPGLLLWNAQKSILPKLEFLKGKGVSESELTKILSAYPTILRISLDKRIVPVYNYLKSILQSDYRTMLAVKKNPIILMYNVKTRLLPNIDTLRKHGVWDHNIAKLIKNWPHIIATNPSRLRESVEEAVKICISPNKTLFFVYVSAILLKSGSESKWESKVSVYKKWGWSEEEISEAFSRSPWCMLASEDKISAYLSFFIDQMGFKPCDLAKWPIVLTYSLDKRVVPRVLLVRALVSKGLVVNQKISILGTIVQPIEKKFRARFVTPYANKAPELIKWYDERLVLSI